MKKVNFTIELDSDEEILQFEMWLEQHVNITGVTILPDTKDLYENDKYFRKLCKDSKTSKQIRDNYINKQLTK